MNTILIVDDEPIIRRLLSRMLELEGYEIYQAEDRMSAVRQIDKHKPDVVLCDVFLPDGNGVDMVREIKTMNPNGEIILLTAHGNISDGVQAIKNGAFDYITKGDDNNKIIPIISRAMDEIKKRQNAGLASANDCCAFDSIIGQSKCLQRVIEMAKKVAVTDVPVLITGETGTGKEVFAQAIHEGSLRKGKPFVAVNCSAFSKELLESEIFGHKAGAFTGALKDKKGLFEEANKGTIFLDEIGEMAYELQAKLLRVIETGEYFKVGDTKPTKIDIRIISATNRNLKDEIAHGNFREDLFFRLSVFQLNLPPLRERKDDIEELAKAFMCKFSKKIGRDVYKISEASLQCMRGYNWSGNVRELKNVIERAIIIGDGCCINKEDLPLEMQESNDKIHDDVSFNMADVERSHISKVLTYTNGNKTEAARLLKIGLTTLYRKIEEYGL